MTAEEYAKVRATLTRIDGLRRAATATVAAGVFVCFIAWLASFESAHYYRVAGELSLVTIIPFVMVAAYLWWRADKYIARLSMGEFEPPRVNE